MNIFVCIKQVPGSSEIEVDESTGVLKREGAEAKMNPYDLYALETALWIKEREGGKVTVLTMGPPQAEAIIREAYMMGADGGYLITDKKFAGSDVLATAYTLSTAIKRIGDYDLIICGKQTTDGDTGQVGPAISEYLNIAHAIWVKSIININKNQITVEQDMIELKVTAKLSFPCLITVDKDIMQPRLPSFLKKLETKDRPVNILTFRDLADEGDTNFGLSGSATQVEKIFPPHSDVKREILEGSPDELVRNIINILEDTKVI